MNSSTGKGIITLLGVCIAGYLAATLIKSLVEQEEELKRLDEEHKKVRDKQLLEKRVEFIKEQIATIEKLRKDGYQSQAVEVASKLLFQVIREKSGIEDKDGSDLINHVFGTKGKLRFNVYPEYTNTNPNEGYVDLLRGIAKSFRNPLAHSTIKLTEKEADIQIGLISYLVDKVENYTLASE